MVIRLEILYRVNFREEEEGDVYAMRSIAIYTCIHIHIYIHVYIYIYTHTSPISLVGLASMGETGTPGTNLHAWYS